MGIFKKYKQGFFTIFVMTLSSTANKNTLKKTVFFIGGGNMASAIISGLDKDVWRVIVADLNLHKLKKLRDDFSVETAFDISDNLINVCFDF